LICGKKGIVNGKNKIAKKPSQGKKVAETMEKTSISKMLVLAVMRIMAV